MSLLFDVICEQQGPPKKLPQAIIEISNVIEYVMESNQETWELKDVPNFAPPFQHFWMEGVVKRSIDSVMNSISILEKTGQIRESIDLRDNINLTTTPYRVAFECHSSELPEQEGWNLRVCFIPASLDCKIFGKLGVCFFYVTVARDGTSSWTFQKEDGEILYRANPETDLHAPIFQAAVLGLAVSFMHCRNVELQKIERPEKVNRKRAKAGKTPLYTYSVIDIQPVKKILKDATNNHLTGIKQRLHICRGHFKTYINKGLFGKYPGTFWWPDQLRGDKALGVSAHDYSVKV